MEQLYRLCNEVLFYVWDPIGVATSAAARDEYDSYAMTVFKYLNEGQNANMIADYLGKVRTTSIGLPASPTCKSRRLDLTLAQKRRRRAA